MANRAISNPYSYELFFCYEHTFKEDKTLKYFNNSERYLSRVNIEKCDYFLIFSRVKMLAVCTVIFGIAIILSGSVNEYWQLVLLRMIMAAGESACNPLATGILSDIFPEEKRALVMSVFNWGIYGGYGEYTALKS